MSTSIVVHCRLRSFIVSRCRHSGIKRQRIPAAFIAGLEDDFAKQIDTRVLAELNPPEKKPAPPRARKAKVYKRALKNQPSLF